MFIPKGKVLHQNLATSFVLIDALVADLCEGGFSGVVEILLRDCDNYIVIDSGTPAGIIERRGEQYLPKTDIAELALKAGAERGRVAIFSYKVAVAKALAGRLFAETLYTKLSTEFADLEKLVGKFLREPKRQWFIEVFVDDDLWLIFIDEGTCSVIKSDSIANDSDLGIKGMYTNPGLLQLIDRCKIVTGVFDVHFKTIREEAATNPPGAERRNLVPEAEMNLPAAPLQPPAAAQSNQGVAPAARTSSEPSPDFKLRASSGSGSAKNGAAGNPTQGAAPLSGEREESPKPKPGKEALKSLATPKAPASQPQGGRILPTRELMALSGDRENAAEDLQMAEVKMLMGEIAKTIEDVLRVVEHRDDFPMHLRAGQLKLANQYAFLDPFGAEFEYMEGEIIFVGRAAVEDFVAGVTEALRLAFMSAVQPSVNPSRLRSFAIDKLRFLFTRSREDYQKYGLDNALEQITGAQF